MTTTATPDPAPLLTLSAIAEAAEDAGSRGHEYAEGVLALVAGAWVNLRHDKTDRDALAHAVATVQSRPDGQDIEGVMYALILADVAERIANHGAFFGTVYAA